MDRLVITIHPTPSDEGLLRVSDAMEQVIDGKISRDAAPDDPGTRPLTSALWATLAPKAMIRPP